MIRRLRPVERVAIGIGMVTMVAIAGCSPADPSTDGNPRAVAQPVESPADASTTSTTGGPTPPSPTTSPTLEKRIVTETQPIPFPQRTVDDSALPQGTRQVRTKGVAGEKTLTFEVTFSGDVQVDKKLIGESVTRAPVTEVVAVGTKPASTCDPNYSGACVPIASDVDCAGGSGDGPAYVRGPVKVIGTDIYRLDNDHDGVGCE